MQTIVIQASNADELLQIFIPLFQKFNEMKEEKEKKASIYNDDDVLTTKEVQAILKVGRSYITTHKEDLKAFRLKPNGDLRFYYKDVKKFINPNKN